MDAVRLIVEALLIEAAASLRESADRAVTAAAENPPYDAYTLAARPLPARLRLFPHPRGLSEADARRITGGKVD